MSDVLKENVLFALCGLSTDVPSTDIPFSDLLATLGKMTELNDYGLKQRLAVFYKRVVSARNLCLEEIYLICEKELDAISLWLAGGTGGDVVESGRHACILNADARRFVETGSTFENQLVSTRKLGEFDACEWEDRFYIEEELDREAKELILHCGRIMYFRSKMAKAIPCIECEFCATKKGVVDKNIIYSQDLSALPVLSAAGPTVARQERSGTAAGGTGEHLEGCVDERHGFISAGSLLMVYTRLNRDFNRLFFPLINAELAKIFKFVFLNDASRISDVLLVFDGTNNLYDYPFRLKYSKQTLKDQIYRILNLDLMSEFTAIELITIELESVLRHFVPERIFSELELIFRYTFALSYLGYYARKTGKNTFFLIVSRIIGFYQMHLLAPKSSSIEECLSNLSLHVRKALCLFGITGDEILRNLNFIDCGMCHILGSRGIADVIGAAKRTNFYVCIEDAEWSCVA